MPGTVAAIRVELSTLKVATCPPKVTLVAPWNPEPKTVMAFPPVMAPPEDARPVTAGMGLPPWPAGEYESTVLTLVSLDAPPLVVTTTVWEPDASVPPEDSWANRSGVITTESKEDDSTVNPDAPVLG